MGTILTEIVQHKRLELESARNRTSLSDLKRKLPSGPVRSLFKALESKNFSLIGEIKVRAPSRGAMRPENVERAPGAYEDSPAIAAISVLTDSKYFGMSLERLQEIRSIVSKPILRKDFIFDEYQIYEARVFGADAILLMATILNRQELERLYAVATDLGLDVLFEAHDRFEIQKLPANARICGINSRKFKTGWARYLLSRVIGSMRDLSIDADTYELRKDLPAGAIHVAESGLDSQSVGRIVALGYRAGLVGNSLLLSRDGIVSELQRFEAAIGAAIAVGQSLAR